MTAADSLEKYDYLCERRLKEVDARLHACFRSSVFAMDLLLANYKNVFPFFTNHTFEHSEQVIHYCNVIAGEKIAARLNADEIYILLMGAALHDIGMGVSESDFHDMSQNIPSLVEYQKAHPGQPIQNTTRLFHQDLSAEFIRKYSPLFEIPSEEHNYCIRQIVRGHRKMDLLDTAEFNPAFPLKNGNTVNLAFLSALVKLADELDITADRNLMFDYSRHDTAWSPKQTLCYLCHGAVKQLAVQENQLCLYFDTDRQEVLNEILHTKSKVEHTFREFSDVVRLRTDFENRIREVQFKPVQSA